MAAFGAKQPFVGIDKGRGPARVVVRSDQRFVRLENARSRVSQESLSGAGTGSKLFSVMRPRFALSEACRHPPVLGAVVKRGARPGAGTIPAGLDNPRCSSRIGCYGISGHPFIGVNLYYRP
jgi:hypothetical protein